MKQEYLATTLLDALDAFRYMLENIGKNDDANFPLEVKKIEDDNYSIALDCLRRHLHVAEYINFT